MYERMYVYINPCSTIFVLHQQVDCGRLDGEQFSKEHGFAGYFETSAKTGSGIKEAIHFMVKKVCILINGIMVSYKVVN